MQAIIKFFFTLFTSFSILITNFMSPGVVLPESDDFNFTYLEYPDEAIITLEEAGLTEQELVGRASAELPENMFSQADIRLMKTKKLQNT